MYSLHSQQPKLCKLTARGLDRASKEWELRHSTYKETLFIDNVSKPVTMFQIMNQRHKICTVKQNKKGLSNFNDKVWISKTEDG